MNLLGNSVIAKLTCEKIALEALSLSHAKAAADATDAYSGSQGTATTSGREGLQAESLCRVLEMVKKCKDCADFRESSRLGCYCFARLLTDSSEPTKPEKVLPPLSSPAPEVSPTSSNVPSPRL